MRWPRRAPQAGDPAAAEQAMREIISEAAAAMLPSHDDRFQS